MAGRPQSIFAGSNGAVVGFAQSYARSGRVEVVAVGLCVAAVVAVLGGGGDVDAEVGMWMRRWMQVVLPALVLLGLPLMVWHTHQLHTVPYSALHRVSGIASSELDSRSLSHYRGRSSKIYWLDLDGIELACFPDRQDSSRVNQAVCSEALRYAGQALDVSYYQSVPGGRYRVFEIVAPDGVLLDYATAHQEYVANEAAMWQRFYNGLLLMTLPFSLLVVLAYWAMGEDY